MIHQFCLSTADLSETGLRRDFLVDPEGQDPVYLQAYDRTTLWYDAFWCGGRVTLICPKLLNFLPLINAAQFSLDGNHTRIARLREYSRHDVIELKSRRCPAEISVVGEQFEVSTPVTEAELARFSGLNTHFTVSLNNDLEWIRDFAVFHRKTQNLQAMVLFDNGSTAYSLSAIEETLKGVGLRDFAIVSAPLSFGRNFYCRKTGTGISTAKFLHTALMNVARLRFLGRARAVLNADIDELVWTEGGNVFDKAAQSLSGYASYYGQWRYPAPRLTTRAMHRDHDQCREETKPCPTKYCIAPRGLLRWLSWDVHKLIGVPFKRRLRTDVGYYHCSRVTTDWKDKPHPRPNAKAAKRKTEEMEIQHDPRARALLDRAFLD